MGKLSFATAMGFSETWTFVPGLSAIGIGFKV